MEVDRTSIEVDRTSIEVDRISIKVNLIPIESNRIYMFSRLSPLISLINREVNQLINSIDPDCQSKFDSLRLTFPGFYSVSSLFQLNFWQQR